MEPTPDQPSQYSNVEELLLLFGIKEESCTRITQEHLSIAKKVSQQLHPDKSKLSNAHFTFYRESYLTLVKLFEVQERYDDNEVESRYLKRMEDYHNSDLVFDKEHVTSVLQEIPKFAHDAFISEYDSNVKDSSWFGKGRAVGSAALIDEFPLLPAINSNPDTGPGKLDNSHFEACRQSYLENKKETCTAIAAYSNTDQLYNSLESVYRDDVFLCGSTQFSDSISVAEQAKLQEFDAENIVYETIDDAALAQKRIFDAVKDELSKEIAYKQKKNKVKLIF
jgi:hypothetical protein